jgi:hypothetical protein
MDLLKSAKSTTKIGGSYRAPREACLVPLFDPGVGGAGNFASVMPFACQPPSNEDPLEALFKLTRCRLATEELSANLAGSGRGEGQVSHNTAWAGEEYASISLRQRNHQTEITDIPRVLNSFWGSSPAQSLFHIDPKKRLNLEFMTESGLRIIVCQWGERSAGLLVDSITVVRFPPAG